MSGIALAVHGGAGRILRGHVDPALEAEAREALAHALRSGFLILSSGGSALEAATAAVQVLEDAECFNAGRGAVLTSKGGVEMDACVMDGSSRRAGAVAGVRHVRNPVAAARAVMENTPHVMLCGPQADLFAETHGLSPMPQEYFITPRRQAQFRPVHADGLIMLDHDAEALGTVGAVARDASGNLAAATSTGGLMNKLPGRVGDSPIPGAGTWADSATCAVSCTGDGEAFIRSAFAHEVDALIRLQGMPLAEACRRALGRVGESGGTGGCIALDGSGFSLSFTTAGMYRGYVDGEGLVRTALYGDEEPGENLYAGE
ncbi:MAG TPA: isoaspartyl peptidase/L-asparaginase, partial [Verrucomicrobiae bacterium]|nr:isoaspartyl peptidase/L-asparaginase [Verrucomicrobiae bacterium]